MNRGLTVAVVLLICSIMFAVDYYAITECRRIHPLWYCIATK